LLVRKTHRGKQIGKALMERVLKDFLNQAIYVMSDVDPYYEKLGYRREGSIFEVKA
jgi:predicted N-acetyltransferase YhbS